MRKAAIFDIDGTLIKVSSERQFFKYLIAEKIVTTKDILRVINVSLYRILSLTNLQVRKNKHYLKGKKVDVIVKAAKTFFNEKLSPLISPKALEEIRCLKEKGYMIILLSGTLIPFVECFKDYCKADLGIGTHLESENGTLTGEMKGTYAYNDGKADIVKKLAKEYNIDLSNSYSYANQDIVMSHKNCLIFWTYQCNFEVIFLSLNAKINQLTKAKATNPVLACPIMRQSGVR